MNPEVVAYRRVARCDLNAHVYSPVDTTGERPAIVFFHGGGFYDGGPSPDGFGSWCQYLAGRGMVAVDVEYRLFAQPFRDRAARTSDPRRRARIEAAIKPRHCAHSVEDCVDDAFAAVAWLRRRH